MLSLCALEEKLISGYDKWVHSQYGGYDHEKFLRLRPRHTRLQLLPKRQSVPFPLGELVRRTLRPVKKIERNLRPRDTHVSNAGGGGVRGSEGLTRRRDPKATAELIRAVDGAMVKAKPEAFGVQYGNSVEAKTVDLVEDGARFHSVGGTPRPTKMTNQSHGGCCVLLMVAASHFEVLEYSITSLVSLSRHRVSAGLSQKFEPMLSRNNIE